MSPAANRGRRRRALLGKMKIANDKRGIPRMRPSCALHLYRVLPWRSGGSLATCCDELISQNALTMMSRASEDTV
eukprot:scaffold193440_cov26-Tisochrysis_lutea.AAC.2